MNDIIRTSRPRKAAAPRSTPVPSPTAPATNELPSRQQFELAIKKPRRATWWLIGVSSFVVVLLIAGLIGYFWYHGALQPRQTTAAKILVKVTSGESTAEVANVLEQKGVIRSSLAAQIYIRLHSQDSIKAGSYLFSPDQTTQEVVQWLNEGRVDTFKVTILPGKRLVEIKQSLVEQGFAAADVDAAFAATYDDPLLKDKPAGVNLEGYIFPETYFMNADATPQDVLKRAFKEFDKRIEQSDLINRLAAHHLTLHQGITLASIVSGEAPGSQDRRQIAQVFERRLDIGMTLGSDITYIYVAKEKGIAPSPDIDSPYNTRKYRGLPPGAVSNFNLDAIEAVANPAAGTYLFFVAGDDGTVHYAYTQEQHEVNIGNYCHKLCTSN